MRRASPHDSAWIMLLSGCGSLNLSKASQFGSALRIRAFSVTFNTFAFPLRTVCCERILPLGVITSARASRSGIMQRYIYMSFFGIGKTQEAFGSIGEACA